MCSFAAAGLIVSILGTVASTVASVQSAKQEAKAAEAEANFQAQVANNNAKIAQSNADMKRQEGIEEARQTRMKTQQKIAAQQAAMAANGVDISEGTPLDIIGDTSAQGELDALTTRYNSETQALAYERQANNYKNQANLDIIAGQNAYRSSMNKARSAGLNGLTNVASVASNWYSPNSIGRTSSSSNSGLKISGNGYGDPDRLIYA